MVKMSGMHRKMSDTCYLFPSDFYCFATILDTYMCGIKGHCAQNMEGETDNGAIVQLHLT